MKHNYFFQKKALITVLSILLIVLLMHSLHPVKVALYQHFHSSHNPKEKLADISDILAPS